MAERFDISTLKWLKGEIDDTLEQARIALTTFVEEGQDESQIGFCVSYLHQVRGSLQLVELDGGSHLASEMEQTARALEQRRITDVESAVEVLMRAFLQLPDYLEALHDGLDDNPVILLPIINELRASRGESALTGAAFFNPDLSALPPPPATTVADLRPVATKARTFFQSHLVKLIQEKELDAGLRAVGSVFEKLLTVTAHDPLRQWLWVFAGLTEGLREQGIPYGKPIKMLFGKVDQLLRQLAAAGEAGVSAELLQEQTKAALFYVAACRSEGRRVSELKRAFRLDGGLPAEAVIEEARARMGGFNTALKRTVAADLMEELTRVKETLDIVSRRPDQAGEELTKLATGLSTIASTVEVLEQHGLAAALKSQVEVVRRLQSGASTIANAELMAIAEAVLAVESALADWGSSGLVDGEARGAEQDPAEAEHRRVVRVVMKEAKVDLVAIKEGINRYLAAPDDKGPLSEAEAPLARLIGGMALIGYERVARILHACLGFIKARMLDCDQVPADEQLDQLADALTSIEYYFEAFVESRVHPASALEVAERSVTALGWPVDQTVEPASSEPVEPEEPTAADAATSEPAPELAELSVPVAEPAVEPVAEPTASPRPAPAPALPPDQDDEIIEIFIEEAEEQFASIAELLPRWRANTADGEALKDLRRCFHTLKGSGRLVGAKDLGEFAWAFESLLNRVIANTVPAGALVFDLIDYARPLLVELLDGFRYHTAPDAHVLEIQELAQILSQPDAPAGLTIPAREVPAVAEAPAVADAPELAEPVLAEPAMDPVLLEIYTNECQGHLDTISEFVTLCGAQGGRCRVDNELVRALHTLRGASRTAGVPPVAELSGLLEDHARILQSEALPLSEPGLALLGQVVEGVRGLIDALANPALNAPDLEAITREARALLEQHHRPIDSESEPGQPLSEPPVPWGSDSAEAALSSLLIGDEPAASLERGLAESDAIHLGESLEPLLVGESEEANLPGEPEPAVSADETLAVEVAELEPVWPEEASTNAEAESAPATSGLDIGNAEDEALAAEMEAFEAAWLEESQSEPAAPAPEASEAALAIAAPEAPAGGLGALDEDWQEAPEGPRAEAIVAAPGLETAEPDDEPAFDLEAFVAAQPDHDLESTGPVRPSEVPDEQPQAAVPVWSAPNADATDIIEIAELPGMGEDLADEAAALEAAWLSELQSPIGLEEIERALAASEIAAPIDESVDEEELASVAAGIEASDADVGDFELDAPEGELERLLSGDWLGDGRHQTGVLPPAVGEQPGEAFTAETDERREALATLEALLGEEDAPEVEAPPAAPVATAASVEEGYDPELLEIFLEEAAEILDESEHQLHSLRAEPASRNHIEALQRSLHTLKGGARMAGINAIADLSHEVETLLARVADGLAQLADGSFVLLEQTGDRLVQMVEALRNQAPLPESEDLLIRLRALVVGEPAGPKSQAPRESAAPMASHAEHPAAEQPDLADYDSDLLEIFLEEASEILDSAEIQLQQWKQNPGSREVIEVLNRLLHTLKGGARMAGVEPIADLSHEVETLLSRVVDGHVAVSQPLIGLLQVTVDRLVQMLDQLRRAASLVSGDDLIQGLRALSSGHPLVPAEEEAPFDQGLEAAGPEANDAVAEAPAESVAAEPAAPAHEAEPAPLEQDRRALSRIRQEMVRVRADLFDGLVNLAGESSIYRSRIGQQINQFRGNFQELDETVARLREQLRQLEIESEAQIQSRFEEVSAEADFDPLEFDRFTRMQQLSRSISESLNDLVSLQTMMQTVVREAETLLLQQSRINTELQEGLVQARMLPLVDQAPRLRRVVRQACADLGRRAELHFAGAEVELDRSVLERMLAPLEHLLRNAVAHGIETPEEREAKAKPPAGEIVIALAREGSEIVIRVKDDGRGIDLGVVRRKAIERGLLSPDTELSDRDVMQFILESGFSTAQVLTQVAGRGVGMDVVNSEVKQLGGSLEIDSRFGEGTTFTVRLPLTLAVSRALLVQSGEEVFAIPLLSIQGIVRITQEELAVLREQQPAMYTWLQNDYQLFTLAQLVGGSALPPADGAKRPLVLAQTGDHRVALEVDGIIGSREVVVKSLGPQLATLHGISGATILGDGAVAMILDLPNLIRQGIARPHLIQAAEKESAPKRPTVMVVDDSITVRRVTQRLLERNDITALTAKDGVEALAMLEEQIPDVMLLDIEMPRMDGYELATAIRNSERLHHIPLIMITSRTGDKHRQRAIDIGVDRYLGKPYQESDLLENITALLGGRPAARAAG